MDDNSNCTIQGNKIQLEMVDEFQCPGCIHGTDPQECPQYKLNVTQDTAKSGINHTWFACENWRPSTFMGGVGRICLGLEKGFNRSGRMDFEKVYPYLRLFETDNRPDYDRFNVPVWAMEKNGYLYVRCFCPRNCWVFVDVIKDGKIEMASFKDGPHEHKAINVSEFYDEID